MIAIWCIFDKFIFLTLHFFYFHHKLYVGLQKRPCKLLEFSLSTRPILFQFFEYLIRAHAAYQQLLQNSLCFNLLCFFSLRSTFKVSMLENLMVPDTFYPRLWGWDCFRGQRSPQRKQNRAVWRRQGSSESKDQPASERTRDHNKIFHRRLLWECSRSTGCCGCDKQRTTNLHRIYKWYRQRAADHYCIWRYIRD